MDDFKDRVAVITGGASGIGLATAKALAAEGMKVVLADVSWADVCLEDADEHPDQKDRKEDESSNSAEDELSHANRVGR